MKNIAYKVFACSFNLCALLPQRRRAALLSPHMASFTDSLGDNGRFQRAEKTMWNDEDLDIPTYIRRSLSLDR